MSNRKKPASAERINKRTELLSSYLKAMHVSPTLQVFGTGTPSRNLMFTGVAAAVINQ